MNRRNLMLGAGLGMSAIQAQAATSEVIASSVAAVFQAAVGMISSGGPFVSTGADLFKILLVILISWKGLKVVLDISSPSQAVAELVQLILVAGIVKFFLLPDTQAQLASGFTTLASTAASSAGRGIDMSNPVAQVADTLGRMLDAAHTLWEGPTDSTSWTDLLRNPMEAMMTPFLAIMQLLMRFFIAILIVASGIIYIGNLFMSQIMVNIGLAVAPIFIPWMLWEATSFLFQGWLKFMITTGVMKIVGALLFGMTYQMVGQVTAIATTAGGNSQVNFYAFAAAFIVVGLMAFMMLQVHSIATGLVSGTPNVAFKPPMAMTPGGMASGASRGAASGAKAAAAGVKGGLKDGWAGAKQGFAQGGMKGAVAAGVKSGASGAWKGFTSKGKTP